MEKDKVVSEFSGMRVLIVDDDAVVRKTLSKALKVLGIEDTDEAGDGGEAVSKVAGAERPFDVAICDLNMPGEDGLTMVQRLGALRYAPAIIIASGVDDNMLDLAGDLAAGHGLKVLGAAPKPMNMELLKELLKKAQLP